MGTGEGTMNCLGCGFEAEARSLEELVVSQWSFKGLSWGRNRERKFQAEG